VASKEKGWRLADAASLSIAPRDGRVELIEFVDLECPFCARYMSKIDSVKQILGDSVRVSYLNFPIEGHRFAKSGAVALECAFAQDRGESFIATAYSNQDSIGFWTWSKYAQRAGVSDTMAFRTCTIDPIVISRVDSARAIAKALQVSGTPSVFIRGWRYDQPPKVAQLVADIRRIAVGKDPQ
jgi:protein-disulfide isomerase